MNEPYTDWRAFTDAADSILDLASLTILGWTSYNHDATVLYAAEPAR